MTRRMWFGTVVPVAAIIYVIVLIATPSGHHVAAIGALLLALVVLVGIGVTRQDALANGRQRNRNRKRYSN